MAKCNIHVIVPWQRSCLRRCWSCGYIWKI